MGLEHSVGSDSASEVVWMAADAVAKTLDNELKDKGNTYNTCGAINVGFYFDEVITPCEDYHWNNEALLKVAKKCSKKLSKLLTVYQKADWEDKTSKDYHIKHVKRLLKSVDSYIKKSNE